MTAKKPTTAEAILMVAQAVRELKDSKQDKQAFEALKTQVKEFLQNVITREEVQRMIAEAELDDLTLEQVQERILAAVADKAATQAVNDKNAEQDEKIRELEKLVGVLTQQENKKHLDISMTVLAINAHTYLEKYQGMIGYMNRYGDPELTLPEEYFQSYPDVQLDYHAYKQEDGSALITVDGSKDGVRELREVMTIMPTTHDVDGVNLQLLAKNSYQPVNLAAHLKQWDMTGDTAVHDDGVQMGRKATLSTTIDTIPNQRYLVAVALTVDGRDNLHINDKRLLFNADTSVLHHVITATDTTTPIRLQTQHNNRSLKLHNAVVIAI